MINYGVQRVETPVELIHRATTQFEEGRGNFFREQAAFKKLKSVWVALKVKNIYTYHAVLKVLHLLNFASYFHFALNCD